MKRLLVAVAFAVVFGSVALSAQQTYVYPIDKPAFSITFPAEWKTEVLEQSVITATSPDESLGMMIWKLPEGLSQEKAINILDEQLSNTLDDINLEDPTINDQNGIKLLEFDGSATVKEDKSEVSVSVIFFKPEGKQNFTKTTDFFVKDARADFIWVYFGTAAGEKQYGDDLASILNSMKKK